MTKRFLIVGHGLAGSTLAWQLHHRNETFDIIDNTDLPGSSRVAGGMINPVTGKHLAKTWLVDELFETLDHFFKEIEEKLAAQFLTYTPLYRPFKNENQKSQFIGAIEKHALEKWVSAVDTPLLKAPFLEDSLGGIWTKKAGRLDVAHFLSKSADFHKSNENYAKGIFDFDALQLKDDKVLYKDKTYEKVVYCEGFYVKNNPYFNWLPMNPVKGETLDVEVAHTPEMIINQGKWLMPLSHNHLKIGATYSWHDLDFKPTADGERILTEGLEGLYSGEYKIVEHKAGVRPSTKDRRPILGKHPKEDRLFVFNGLGTKGVSLAPYFSKQMAEHLIEGKEIDSLATIERHYPLY